MDTAKAKNASGVKTPPGRRNRSSTLVVLSLWLSPFAHGQDPAAGFTRPPAAETVVLPKSVPDPMEPLNRVMWAFNKGLMTGVIKPTSKVYRVVVVKPVRTGIGNFGKNLTYPGRLINNLLQGKWSGARDESYRFVCNTTVGVAGFFDVAGKWKIPKSDADFGQTFGQCLQYSYQDYFEKFAIPYYQDRGVAPPTAEALEKAGDLRTYDAGLRANRNIRIIVNQNDFLLADEDLAWLHATFAPEQLTVFKQGGHLGNLFNPAVQKTILEALAGLKSSPLELD
jgi:MlaA lipoprotein